MSRRSIGKQWRPAIVGLLLMTVICGVVYTGVVTGLAQLFFPHQAEGSFVTVTLKDGTTRTYGSALIAQEFTEQRYLIGRPPGVSTLSPTSDQQAAAVNQRVAWWHSFDPANSAPIPLDLVTESGSGVDPHISPAAAEYQVDRIAAARGVTPDDVRAIIEQHTSGRFLWLFGDPAVDVLQVNLALDGLL